MSGDQHDAVILVWLGGKQLADHLDSEWCTLIGRDCLDTVLSLVELDYADGKDLFQAP